MKWYKHGSIGEETQWNVGFHTKDRSGLQDGEWSYGFEFLRIQSIGAGPPPSYDDVFEGWHYYLTVSFHRAQLRVEIFRGIK